MDHDQLQSHVEQLFEQPSRAAVARRAVGLVETAVGPSAVGLYSRPGDGTELVASAGEPLPSSLAGVSAVDRAVDTGAPVTGTPPPSVSRHESWCCVSTGGEGVLVAADPAPDAFDSADGRRLSQFAVGVGAALRAVGTERSVGESEVDGTDEQPVSESGTGKPGGRPASESGTSEPGAQPVGETDGGTTSDSVPDQSAGEVVTDEQLFRAIRDVYPDYAFLHDREGRYLDVVLGHQGTPLNRRSELLGQTVEEVLPPAPAETVLDAIRAVLDTGDSESITYTLETPAGERIFEAVVTPVTVGGDDRTVLVARDVTEREQRRRDLSKTETWTEFALEQTNSLVWTVDVETGRVDSFHGGVEPMTATDPEEDQTMSAYVDNVVHADDRETVRRALDEVLSGEREELHVEYRTTADTERWVVADAVVRETTDRDDAAFTDRDDAAFTDRDDTVSIDHDDTVSTDSDTRATSSDGDSRQLVGIAREITDRKRWERRLTALHEAVADIADASSVTEICRETVAAGETALDLSACLVAVEEDGVLLPEATGSAVSTNDYELKSTDQGIAGWTFHAGESVVITDQQTHDLAQTDGDSDYRSLLSVPIGDHGVLQVGAESAGAFDDRDRQLAELLANHAAVALDLLSSRQRLEARNDRLEEFTSLVSHDLRNPLEVAMGHLDLATAQPGEAESHLKTVADAHDRIDDLIDDVLALARTDTVELATEPVAVGKLARQCWGLVETSEATLTVTTDDEIVADPSQLRRLFENLFRNAVEHGGGAVTVGELSNGFYVADDGPGVPPADRDEIFEPGYSSQSSGTGFGLSIVRGVASKHGWHVGVTDAADGGARFEVRRVDTA